MSPPILEIVIVIFCLPLFWMLICSCLSLFSGWFKLGRRYSNDKYGKPHEVEGEYFRGMSGIVGLPFFAVSYSGCLHVIVGEPGLGLRVSPIFRVLSPNITIPWQDIDRVVHKRILFISWTRIYVKGFWRRITLFGRSGTSVSDYYNEL